MVENHQGAAYRPLLSRFAGPALLLLIVVGSFWKLTLSHRQYTWMESGDISFQVMPWLQYEAGEFHRGHFPLWDPYEWGGQSLIGQAQPAAAYPLNWLLYSMPLKNGWIQQIYLDGFFVGIHYLAGLFAYWLCRDLKRSMAASLLGGSTFALAAWVGNTDWPQMINGGIWAPLIFLFFFRMMRGEQPIRNSALSGAMLGMAFLSGHHQIPIFTGLAIGGAWIYWLARDVRTKDQFRVAAISIAAFATLFALVGAFQILPGTDYGKQALRWVGANNPAGWKDIVPYRVHAMFSLPPASILGLVIGPAADHTVPYVGFCVLLMGAAAVLAGWRNVYVRIMAAVALGGFFLSMGQWNIFHGLIYSLLPQVDKARNISFGSFVWGFGVSILAAFGVDLFLEVSQAFRKVLIGIASVGGFAMMIAVFTISQSKLPQGGDQNLIAFCGMIAIAIAVVLLLWQSQRLRHAPTALLLLALVEFGTTLGWGYRSAESPDYLLKKMSQHSEIAQWLRSQPGPMRVEVDDQEIPYNFGDWYGIDVYGGYLASITVNVVENLGQYPARALMGVKYDVGRKPIHPEKEVEVFHDKSGLKVWEHADAFPRVWSVHETKSITHAQMDAAYNMGLDRLHREAFFVDQPAPKVEKCSGDSVNLVRRDANEVEIDALMTCKGMVIAGETYDKGWSAKVDGKSTPLLEAYGTARAVEVPQGHHRIVMQFYPRSIVLGALMTGLGFLLILGMLLL